MVMTVLKSQSKVSSTFLNTTTHFKGIFGRFCVSLSELRRLPFFKNEIHEIEFYKM